MKTLTQHLEGWLQHEQAGQCSPHTIRMQRHCVGHTLDWLRERHGIHTADRLTPAHFDAWAQHVIARRTPKGLPLKPTTIAKQFDCDRGFVSWLEKCGAVPARLHDAVPKYRVPNLLPTSVLTHARVTRLLEQTDDGSSHGFMVRCMLELLYSSGVRPAELVGMDVDSVDLVARTARVFGKGKKERLVPFGQTAQRYLTSYLKSVRPLFVKGLTERALWLDRSGHRMRYHTFRREFIEAIKGIKLPVGVTAYTLRRSCATELIRGGANLYLVSELLGHESLETIKHYAKLTIVDLKKTHAKCHPRERDRK